MYDYGGVVNSFYYCMANLPKHYVFQGKKVFYCGLVLCSVM